MSDIPQADNIWWYQAVPTGAIDGDTIEVIVDMGMFVRSAQHLRLLGVFAPERSQPGGKECTIECENWLFARTGKPWSLLIRTEKDKQSFNRYVAEVLDRATGESLCTHMNDFITANGYGHGTL